MTAVRSDEGGIQLRFHRTGIEGKLLGFIEDAGQSVNNEAWFNLDRLLFETDSAVLRPESREQLRNIGEILKAYPNVQVKVGGYTDSSGDPSISLRPSQDRANSVRQELLGLGIGADRITVEGYGQEHAVGGQRHGSWQGTKPAGGLAGNAEVTVNCGCLEPELARKNFGFLFRANGLSIRTA